mgnify:CR=1 FL=1
MLELPTKLLSLGTGQEATYNTLEHMARLISNGAKSYEVRSVAVELVKHLPAKDQWAEVRSIFNFVKTYMRYTKDPHGVEMLHTPQAILKLIKEESGIGRDQVRNTLEALNSKGKIEILRTGGSVNFYRLKI